MIKKAMCLIMLVLLLGDVPHSRAEETVPPYRLVFSDEFNLPNGSRPDSTFWSVSPRGQSGWNRWISASHQVAYIQNGYLVCRAIRNITEPTDTAIMLTGAMETMNKYSFQYGKIEVRARTRRHTGNFCAIWLMPQPPAPGHPHGGEIDIFESEGSTNNAHGTVHTNWTYILRHTMPTNHFVKKINVNRWHVYGLEWSPTQLTWSIDGKITGIYRKSANPDALENGQWPFDRPFYIILNQSVGLPGGWTGNPDYNHVYETRFDWVRVYQREES